MELCANGIHDLDVVGSINKADGFRRCRGCKRRGDRISACAKRRGISLKEAAALDVDPDAFCDPETKPEPIDPGFSGTFGAWFTAAATWMQYGMCREPGAPDMYPTAFDRMHIEACKTVCGTCYFQRDCLSYALANGEECGVWGGMTAPERKRFLRSQKRSADGEYAAAWQAVKNDQEKLAAKRARQREAKAARRAAERTAA